MEKRDFKRNNDEDGEQNAEIQWSLRILSNMWPLNICKNSMATISKLRFQTISVLIVSDDGLISQTNPHSLEMVIGASNRHTQQQLDFLFEDLVNGYNSIIFG
jgi:hypothetical protein